MYYGDIVPKLQKKAMEVPPQSHGNSKVRGILNHSIYIHPCYLSDPNFTGRCFDESRT
jgi:hypothetical protein